MTGTLKTYRHTCFSERLSLGLAHAGGVIKRPNAWLAIFVHADKFDNSQFRLAKLTVARLEQADTLLEAAQRVLQANLAVLQIADDFFEFDEALLERRTFGHICHVSS